MMPRRRDPIYNDDDRADQYFWDDRRDEISRLPGGTRHSPDPIHVPPADDTRDRYRPPAAIEAEWRKLYAGMSRDRLRAEQDDLYDEMEFLAGLNYVAEHQPALNRMKLDLVAEALAAIRN